MIRRFVDLALSNCFRVLGLAILAVRMGVVSFQNLPIEAYPDVANNYVEIITQWSGIAAEEVEQQVIAPSRS
jgi:cobalt-zinc-cadmium resistance protein CzcA